MTNIEHRLIGSMLPPEENNRILKDKSRNVKQEELDARILAVQYSQETEPELEEASDIIWEHLLDSTPAVKDLGLKRPKIFYFSPESWPQFLKERQLDKSEILETETTKGIYDSTVNHIYIIRNHQQTIGYEFDTLAHELAHAFRRPLRLYKPETSAGINYAWRYFEQSGFNLRNGECKFNDAFEEFYAVEKQLLLAPLVRANLKGDEIQNLFRKLQNLHSAIKKQEKTLSKCLLGIPQNDWYKYIYPLQGEDRSISAYATCHYVISKLISKVPNGMELFEKARITNRYGEFSRAFNKIYGPGSFAVALKCNTEPKNILILNAYLQAKEPEKKAKFKKQLEEQLSDPLGIRNKLGKSDIKYDNASLPR